MLGADVVVLQLAGGSLGGIKGAFEMVAEKYISRGGSLDLDSFLDEEFQFAG